jgi:splicing factor 45
VKSKSKPNPLQPESTEAPSVYAAVSGPRSRLQDVARIQEDIANDDVNGYQRTLEGQKLARKLAKKRKRNQAQGNYVWTWDDDYDPLHPNDYETYIDSDEHLREQIDWQNKLEGKDEFDRLEEMDDTGYHGFAPPWEDADDDWTPPEDDGHEFVPEPVTEIALDESADEIYARRLRLAQQAGMKIRPPTPPSAKGTPKQENEPEKDKHEEPKPEISEPAEVIPNFYDDEPMPPAPPIPPPPSQPLFNFNTYNQPPSLYASAPGMQPSLPRPPPSSTTISSEPVHYASATISSEPVHYSTSTATIEPVVDQPRNSLPGQKGFAARYMSKHGWEKGQSLGATAQTGFVTPLMMKADKEKKGTGVIINRNKAVEDHGPHGKMSRCIVLANVVAPGEVDDELVDEIGEECRSKVVRLLILLI